MEYIRLYNSKWNTLPVMKTQQQGVQKIILRLWLQNEYDTKGVYPFRVS